LWIILILSYANSTAAVLVDQSYPKAVNKLVIDTEQKKKSQQLTKAIGLEFGKRYTFSNWSKVCDRNKIGIAGEYEELLYSVGKPSDITSWEKTTKVKSFWEMAYYKNLNITMIHETDRNTEDGSTWVRVVKIARGRKPKLNLE
jgi:uncharacterized protein (UPF0333 family)